MTLKFLGQNNPDAQQLFALQGTYSHEPDATALMEELQSSVTSGTITVLSRPGLTIVAGDPVLEGLDLTPQEFRHQAAASIDNLADIDSNAVRLFGLVPFDPTNQPSLMELPEFSIAVQAGSSLLCVIANDEKTAKEKFAKLELAIANAATSPTTSESHPTTRTKAESQFAFTQDDSSWLKLANVAIERIRTGEFEKVVLSRRSFVAAPAVLDRTQAMRRLTHLYRSAFSFSYRHLLGATPELLVRRVGGFMESHPLAGTANTGDEAVLLASEKDNHEHLVVVKHITDRLKTHCDRIETPDSPSITSFGSICHLGTQIKGFLSRDNYASSLELLLAIHPTPAVAGVPQRPAMSLIQELEDQPRHFYAGAIGYETLDGDGEWHLVIRTVAISRDRIEFQAGVGLVAESDPDAELAELQAKLSSMLPIIGQ